MGKSLAALEGMDPEGELHNALRQAFSGERFKQVLDHSLNTRDEDIREFTDHLTAMEQRLFDAGYQASTDFIGWKSRQKDTIQVSAAVARETKRQRVHK
jgi:hypothetical protein